VAIRFKCQCGKEFSVADNLAGKKAKCPGCGEMIVIPGSPPGAAVGGPQTGHCPNCGGLVSPVTIICPACKYNLRTGERAPGELLRAKKKGKSGLVVAAVVALVAVVAVVVVLLKGRKPQTPAAGEQPTEQEPGAGAKPSKATKPALAARPVITLGASVFSCPELDARTHLRFVWDAAKLDELAPKYIPKDRVADLHSPWVPESESLDAAYKYVGQAAAGLARHRALAYDAKPNSDGKSAVLFSDGSVLHLDGKGLAAVLLKKVGAYWLTPGEQKILADLGPQLDVRNERLTQVDVLVDNKKVGTIAYGQTGRYALSAGAHAVVLATSGARTKPISLQFQNAFVYAVHLPKHCALPIVPVRVYQRCMGSRRRTYQARKSGGRVVELRSRDGKERVIGGAQGLKITGDTIAGVIQRDGIRVTGVSGGPIKVSSIGRLEEGDVSFPGGAKVVCRSSELGTLTIATTPNRVLADRARLKRALVAGAGTGERDMPGGEFDEFDELEDMGRPGGWGRGRRTEAAFEIKYQQPQVADYADLQAIRPALRRLGRGALRVALAQMKALTAGRASPEEGRDEDRDEDWDEDREEEREGPGGRRTRRVAFTIPDGFAPGALSGRDAIALVGFYADPAMPPALADVATQQQTGAAVSAQSVIALGQIGGGLAAVQIVRATEKVKGPAPLVALAMASDVTAQNTLEKLLKKTNLRTVTQALRGWPAAAGPEATQRFIQALVRSGNAAIQKGEVVGRNMNLDPGAALQA